jgi:hypothetical protein
MPVSKLLPKNSLYSYLMIVASYIIYTKSILLNLPKFRVNISHHLFELFDAM